MWTEQIDASGPTQTQLCPGQLQVPWGPGHREVALSRPNPERYHDRAAQRERESRRAGYREKGA